MNLLEKDYFGLSFRDADSNKVPVCLHICLSVSVTVYLSVCLSLPVYASVCLSAYLCACLTACLSVFLPAHLSVCPSVCLPACLTSGPSLVELVRPSEGDEEADQRCVAPPPLSQGQLLIGPLTSLFFSRCPLEFFLQCQVLPS